MARDLLHQGWPKRQGYGEIEEGGNVRRVGICLIFFEG